MREKILGLQKTDLNSSVQQVDRSLTSALAFRMILAVSLVGSFGCKGPSFDQLGRMLFGSSKVLTQTTARAIIMDLPVSSPPEIEGGVDNRVAWVGKDCSEKINKESILDCIQTKSQLLRGFFEFEGANVNSLTEDNISDEIRFRDLAAEISKQHPGLSKNDVAAILVGDLEMTFRQSGNLLAKTKIKMVDGQSRPEFLEFSKDEKFVVVEFIDQKSGQKKLVIVRSSDDFKRLCLNPFAFLIVVPEITPTPSPVLPTPTMTLTPVPPTEVPPTEVPTPRPTIPPQDTPLPTATPLRIDTPTPRPTIKPQETPLPTATEGVGPTETPQPIATRISTNTPIVPPPPEATPMPTIAPQVTPIATARVEATTVPTDVPKPIATTIPTSPSLAPTAPRSVATVEATAVVVPTMPPAPSRPTMAPGR